MAPAQLVLASGEVFTGFTPNDSLTTVFGEVVFNTGMVGYPETLTDPSYTGQILVFTYPLIGNYGVPNADTFESDGIKVSAVVLAQSVQHFQHHQAQQSFIDWCLAADIPVLVDVDTRAITKCIRSQGVVPGAITTSNKTPKQFVDVNRDDLVGRVSVKEPITYGQGDKTVVVVDCGIKHNILRHLCRDDITIKRVPYTYDFTQETYDGVFISNGPGDPMVYQTTIDIIAKALASRKPVFGICLGTQLMAHAIGAQTYKLPFGHRSQNQPCLDLATKRCYLTSQNHGFAIKEDTLPSDWQVSFRHLNDDSVQGITHKRLPQFSVQFHPEAAPGPVDTQWLFDKFFDALHA